jgi:hypothetical protein
MGRAHWHFQRNQAVENAAIRGYQVSDRQQIGRLGGIRSAWLYDLF